MPTGTGRRIVVSVSVSALGLLAGTAPAAAQTVQFDPPAANYPAGTAPTNLVLADLNGDGRLDVAFSDRVRRTVRVYHGQGNGALAAAPTIGFGAAPQGLDAGDVNGDGRIDLVVGGVDLGNPLMILLNNGDGTWQRQTATSPGPIRFLTLRDFTGDGKLDVGAVCQSTVCVFANHGDGTFDPAQVVSMDASAVAAGDLNNDGRLDLAAVDAVAHRLSLATGRGDGTFDPAVTYDTAGQPESVALADFDADGRADVVVSQWSSSDPALNGIVLYAGQGNGTLAPGRLTPTSTIVHRVAVADYNGDGWPDVAVGGNNPGALVLTGDGEGNFEAPIGFPTNGGPVETAGDLNRDGKPDLATLGGSATVVTILLNSTGGLFGPPRPVNWTRLVNTTAAGTEIRKTGGCDGCYDAAGFSDETIAGTGSAAFEFIVRDPAPVRIVGFSQTASGLAPDSVDFGLRLQGAYAEVRERGVFRRDIFVQPGDVLRVTIVNGVVRYLKNGAPFYVSGVGPAYPMSIAAFFASMDGTIDDARIFGPAGGGGGGGGGVTWTQSVNVTTSSDSIRKSSGCDGCYDAWAVSEETLDSTDSFVEFTADDEDLLLTVGVTSSFSSPDTTAIDFGLRLQSGYAEVREHGAYRADVPFVAGDVFRISIVSGVVTYEINGQVFYTSTEVPAAHLFLAALLANLGASISEVSIGGS